MSAVKSSRGGLNQVRVAVALTALIISACASTNATTSAAEPAIAATLSTASTTSTTAAPASTEVRVVLSEPYRISSEGDPDASTVDVYVPEGEGPHPAVILLHGYSSALNAINGDPDTELAPMAEEIARLGAVVFYFSSQSAGITSDSRADLSCIAPYVSARVNELDRRILESYKQTIPKDMPIGVAVQPGQETTYAELVEGLYVWDHSPNAAELDGFAALVEAADDTRVTEEPS